MPSSLEKRILKAARQIPRGKVAPYGEIARAAGSPRAARFVGFLMSRNRSREVPCHRVVCSDGRVGKFSLGGTGKKAELLACEGVKIKNGKIDLSVFGRRFR